jgi:hypothetical protein
METGLPRRVKGAGKNKYTVLHHVFRPSLPFLQSQNPQRSPATPAVLLNQERQIQPKSARKTWYISLFRLPKILRLAGDFFYVIKGIGLDN